LTIMGPKRGCQPTMIGVTVNGEPQFAPEGQTIMGLLQQLELDPARVAVELDRHIVKQNHWAETEIRPGAQIEIVQFVGGG